MCPPHCFSVFSKAWNGPSLFPASENPGELVFIESGLSSLAWPVASAVLHTLVLAYFSNLVFNHENCISATLSFSPSSGHTTLSHAITTLGPIPPAFLSSCRWSLTLASMHLPTFITAPAVFGVCLSPPTDNTLLQCKARLNPRTSYWHVVETSNADRLTVAYHWLCASGEQAWNLIHPIVLGSEPRRCSEYLIE